MTEPRLSTGVTAETLEALNRAALAISRNLDLDSTLQQIVNSARELLAARFAALGVFDHKKELKTFIFSGMSEEQARRIGHFPEGRGLLSAVLESDGPIRLANLRKDPRSVGFPPEHPPMMSFLGCPIVAGDRVVGNLYLTDKIGEPEFTPQDEELIETFSAHAAAAIENARLFLGSQERTKALAARNRELRTLYRVSQATGTYTDLDQVISQVLDEVLELTGAQAGEVFLLEAGSSELVLRLHRGESAEAFHTIGRFPIGVGFPGRAAETGEIIATRDLSQEPRYSRAEVVRAGFRSVVCVPLKAKGDVLGTLNLADKNPREFNERDLALLEAIGHLMGTAIENARLYDEIGRLAILEERARIGMDLHDGVIQSIYAVGLTLETVQQLTAKDPQKASELLRDAIEGLNGAIRDIRNFILDLRPRRFEGNLVQGLAGLVREFQANTLVGIDVHVDEEVARDLPAGISRAIFFTAQEGLANIARHAQASKVELELGANGDRIHLRLQDDGRGFDPEKQDQSVGHGLANMQARAEELGGIFKVHSAPGEGTTLELHIPRS